MDKEHVSLVFRRQGPKLSLDVRFGGFPAGSDTIQLKVFLPDGSQGFPDGPVSRIPITDTNGDGLDDGFSDEKTQAWQAYFKDADAEEEYDIDGLPEVGAYEDPNSFMPDDMIEDVIYDDDDDFENGESV